VKIVALCLQLSYLARQEKNLTGVGHHASPSTEPPPLLRVRHKAPCSERISSGCISCITRGP
jgi:hypothetical protein